VLLSFAVIMQVSIRRAPFPFAMALAVGVTSGALAAQQPEALSLLGKPLYARHPKGEAQRSAAADLAAARAAVEKEPASVDRALAVASAQVANGNVLDAIETCALALEKHPDDPRLLLERGRLLLVIRKIDPAIRDLRKASATLPDGRCAFAFAEYVAGTFKDARRAFGGCPGSPWAPAAAARTGAPLVPPASKDPLVDAYYAALDPLVRKDTARARDLLKKIVDKQDEHWTEDAYLAAEADLARLPKRKKKQKGG
jgi:tetratricopeptide (TPR) repeat protein